MKKNVDEIKKQLDHQTAKWICPISGVQFDANDKSAIEAHKANLLKEIEVKAAEKEVRENQKKALDGWQKELKACHNLNDIKAWVDHWVQLKTNQPINVPIKVMNVTALKKQFNELNYHYFSDFESYFQLEIEGLLPAEIRNLKKQLTLAFKSSGMGFKSEKVKDEHSKIKDIYYIQVNSRLFALPVQNKLSELNFPKKLDKKEVLAVLKKDKAYQSLIEQMQLDVKEIQLLRQKHKSCQEQMQKLHDKLNVSQSQSDFPSKLSATAGTINQKVSPEDHGKEATAGEATPSVVKSKKVNYKR